MLNLELDEFNQIENCVNRFGGTVNMRVPGLYIEAMTELFIRVHGVDISELTERQKVSYLLFWAEKNLSNEVKEYQKKYHLIMSDKSKREREEKERKRDIRRANLNAHGTFDEDDIPEDWELAGISDHICEMETGEDEDELIRKYSLLKNS